jgi:hypothetical protein
MTDVQERPVPPSDPPGSEPGRSSDPEGGVSAPAVDTRALGVRAVVAGAAAMTLGQIVDIGDGAATTSGLARALLLGGAGVVVAGLVLAAVGPVLYGSPGRDGGAGAAGRSGPGWQAARVVAPMAVVALLAAFAVWAARSGAEDDAGDHVVTTGDHHHSPAAAPAPAGETGTGGHVHGEGPAVPLDAATQKELNAQMAVARDATMRYPTVADAEKGGLRRVGIYAPGSGAHYMQDVRPGFDPGSPTMWLFAGNEPTSPVVGLMYYSLNETRPPEGFAGPNDHWHQHNGLCLKHGPEGVDLPLPVDKDATRPQCDAVGGQFLDATGWMIHVWTAPGWESPEGVFSHDHPLLVCSDGKSATEAQLHVGCKGMG